MTKRSEHRDIALKQQIIYIMLLKSGKYSFLPELLDIVGRDKMMELLQLFAGIEFKFPTMSEIEMHAKEVNVFFRIHKANKGQRSRVVKELVDEYYVDDDMINYIYKKMKRILQDELLIPV